MGPAANMPQSYNGQYRSADLDAGSNPACGTNLILKGAIYMAKKNFKVTITLSGVTVQHEGIEFTDALAALATGVGTACIELGIPIETMKEFLDNFVMIISKLDKKDKPIRIGTRR